MSFSKRIIIPLAFTLFLLIIRIILSNELTYVFLAWNLFLAWIPFALSQTLGELKNRWKLFFLIGAWLLFLPNAPYIITDFLHLKQRAPVPYWYDILLLFSASSMASFWRFSLSLITSRIRLVGIQRKNAIIKIITALKKSLPLSSKV